LVERRHLAGHQRDRQAPENRVEQDDRGADDPGGGVLRKAADQMYTGEEAEVARTIGEWTSSVVLPLSAGRGAQVRK